MASLINGTVDIANASRKIKEEEIAEAQSNGVEPVEHIIARDAIAVIVNPENPVSQLTLKQISDIYSGKINNWSELGGEDRPIVRLSRETNSGTHVYFLETVLRMGNSEDQDSFLHGYITASVFRRDYCRSAAESQRHWIRWSRVCAGRSKDDRHCRTGGRCVCTAVHSDSER